MKDLESASTLDQMTMYMKEWKKMRDQVSAPKFIWREMSPQHWPNTAGEYDKQKGATWRMSPPQCRATSEQDRNFILNSESSRRSLGNKLFATAVSEAGMAVDDVNIAILPIARATLERDSDHPHTKRIGGSPGGADCTHYCIFSPVYYFWSASLVSVFAGMKERELK
eukprot:gnl/MRDRNA2_/MRDRNA2_229071_c0_seq1.p1 gnl/MRDRNA2_/MRDRNA2_229071_c0~~gnl/MRDRNA2_/MRDRNA2_229071_c0_seq1.p1  ORF type:complete len:168 (+),score=21.77 gnl/MRDRNA2_/MRDRNA2_229071_c0_seq1:3-506(+)